MTDRERLIELLNEAQLICDVYNGVTNTMQMADYLLENGVIIVDEKALEKQIPKKPDFESDGYCDGQLVYDTWICPCCEKSYEADYDKYDYCPNCGQSIDWSE